MTEFLPFLMSFITVVSTVSGFLLLVQRLLSFFQESKDETSSTLPTRIDRLESQVQALNFQVGVRRND